MQVVRIMSVTLLEVEMITVASPNDRFSLQINSHKIHRLNLIICPYSFTITGFKVFSNMVFLYVVKLNVCHKCGLMWLQHAQLHTQRL